MAPKTSSGSSIVASKHFYGYVLPVMLCLSELLDEIYWEDRLNPFNHGTHFFFFADRFTAIFDFSELSTSLAN